jgi:hypothetical protein
MRRAALSPALASESTAPPARSPCITEVGRADNHQVNGTIRHHMEGLTSTHNPGSRVDPRPPDEIVTSEQNGSNGPSTASRDRRTLSAWLALCRSDSYERLG